MEESFELLSSMSPKVDKTRTFVKKTKGPTKLALKKSLRRSAIFDKLPHTTPANVVVDVETSTESSKSSKKGDPIVIADSDDDIHLKTSNIRLSETKLDSIQKWVEDVDADAIVCEPEELEIFFLSHISSIHGDGNGNGNNGIANSTVLNQSDKFREFFTGNNGSKSIFKHELKKAEEEKLKQVLDTYQKNLNNMRNNEKKSLGEVSFDSVHVIEDSFEEKKGSDMDEFFSVKDTLSGPGSNNDSIENKVNYYDIPGTPANAQVDYEECKSLLDELYGNSWRKNKDKVLPKSEPRPRKKNPVLNQCPNTEIKTKNSEKINNPYLDSEVKKSRNLLKTLQSARVKAALESPWLSRLDALCDVESSEDEREKPNDFKNVKTKLQFDEFENDNSSKDSKDTQSNSSDINKYRTRISSISSTDSEKIKNKKKASFSSTSSDWIDDFSDDCQVTLKDKILKKKLPKVKKKEKKPFKSYWDDEINNSLEEKLKTKLKIQLPTSEPIRRTKYQRDTIKPESFLASLSKSVPVSQCDSSALIFRNNFKHYRDQLVTKLFKLYNDKIFNNCIPEDTPIEWSDRMTGTAGYCSCVKVTRRTGVIERKVKLKLATKILDSADRLRDTLVHEMCHAATWIANKVSDGHGNYWKAWASKAMNVFPELPPITRCHDYAINTKYTYKCTGCGYSVGRHSKSLDLDRKRCGHCYGTFEVLINKISKTGETKSVPSKTKGPSAFALFVKEKYKDYKSPNLEHKEVMKVLGQKYKEINFK